MELNEIVDREEESKRLLPIIKESNGLILFLYAYSGVGKSTFTEKLSKLLTEKIVINTFTRPENVTDSISDGQFITDLFNSFVRTTLQNEALKKYTFEYYILNSKNNSVRKKAIEEIIQSIDQKELKISMIKQITKHTLARIFKVFEFNKDSYLTLKDREAYIIAKDYINFVLKQGSIFWTIDNFQNIDIMSKNLINEILFSQPKTNVCIFEYTISDKKTCDDLLEYSTYLKHNGLNTKEENLQQLKPADALSVLSLAKDGINDQAFKKKAKEFYENENDGNIYKLKSFKMTYASKGTDADPILKKIKSLEKNELFVMALVILHCGEISIIALENIIRISVHEYFISNYQDILKRLEKLELIKIESNIIRLEHASIIDTWQLYKDSLKIYEYVGYSIMKDYYNQLLESDIIMDAERATILKLMLDLCVTFDPKNIITYFFKFSSFIYEKVDPSSMMKYAKIFITSIESEFDTYIQNIYRLIQFSFNYNLYTECLDIIRKLKEKTTEYDIDLLSIYEINCLEYLEKHEAAISLCLQRLQNNLSNKQKYNYYLLLIGCYRSLNRKDQSLIYHEKIKAIPNYETYPEYGIFLRLKEIFHTRKEAVPFLKESSEFFEQIGDMFQEIKSRITYAYLLTITNNLPKAYYELDVCENKARKTNLFSNVFLLNRSSMMILENKFGNEIEDMLLKAELSTNSPFDKLIILTLRLINSYEIGSTDKFASLLQSIQELLSCEKDKHLIALIAYDLYLFYKYTDQEETSLHFLSIAEKYQSYNNTVSYKLKHDVNPTTSILFNTKWAVGFTFFWNVDYKMSLYDEDKPISINFSSISA